MRLNPFFLFATRRVEAVISLAVDLKKTATQLSKPSRTYKPEHRHDGSHWTLAQGAKIECRNHC